jgi:hypothetical protein
MEKIFQIIAVLAVLMLAVVLFFREREPRYRPFGYLRRIKPSLPDEVRQRLASAVSGAALEEERQRYAVDGDVDALLFDEGERLLFCYKANGSLVIFRRTGQDTYKEMQWLAAPLDCAGFFYDPEEKNLYFEAGGSLFVYGV